MPLGTAGAPAAGTGEVELGPKGLLTQAPHRPGVGAMIHRLPRCVPQAARNGTDSACCLPLRGAVYEYISQLF